MVGGEEENKNEGKNFMVLEYSVQVNHGPLCVPTATSNYPTNSSGEQMAASSSSLIKVSCKIYCKTLTSVLFQAPGLDHHVQHFT